MKKAYGYPLTPDQNNCFGICLTEDGKYLGCWTSSNYSWLARDLKHHATDYNYEFIPQVPDKDRVIIALINKINEG